MDEVCTVLRAAGPAQRKAGWIAGTRHDGSTGRRCMLGVLDSLGLSESLKNDAIAFLANFLRPRIEVKGVPDPYNHDTAYPDSPPTWIIAAFSNVVVPQVVGSDDANECAEKAASIFESAAEACAAEHP